MVLFRLGDATSFPRSSYVFIADGVVVSFRIMRLLQNRERITTAVRSHMAIVLRRTEEPSTPPRQEQGPGLPSISHIDRYRKRFRESIRRAPLKKKDLGRNTSPSPITISSGATNPKTAWLDSCKIGSTAVVIDACDHNAWSLSAPAKVKQRPTRRRILSNTSCICCALTCRSGLYRQQNSRRGHLVIQRLNSNAAAPNEIAEKPAD